MRTEAGEGLNRGILLPVLMDDVVIPLAYRRIQAADLTAWEPYEPNDGFDGLIAAIASLVGGEAAAAHPVPSVATPVGASTEAETVGAVGESDLELIATSEKMFQRDPTWMFDGRWGLIQFAS